MLPYGTGVAQVMMIVDEAVEKRLLGRAPHQAKFQWLKFGKLPLNGRGVQEPGLGWPSAQGVVGHHAAGWRKGNVAGALKREHEPAGQHARWNAIGLSPVPGFTQKYGESVTAGAGMARDYVTNERDVLRAQGPAAVFE